MAFASVGSLGTANGKVSGTTISIAVLAAVAIGDIVAVWIAKDNANTTDGDFSEVSGVADIGGNTYVKLGEQTNGQGAGAAGITGAIWYSNITTGLSITNLITVTFSAAVDAKAVSAWQFTKTAANTLAVEGAVQVSVGDAADPGALTFSSLTSREYLILCVTAVESVITDTYTVDADYTAITRDATSGGGGATNVYVAGGFRIATLTGDTFDSSSSAGRDHAQVGAPIYEVSAASAVGPLIGGKLVNHSILQGRLVRT